MQSNNSRTEKQVEPKKSKWRLFSKGSSKSTDQLDSKAKPGDRQSDGSGTTSDGTRASASIDTSHTLVNGHGLGKEASSRGGPPSDLARQSCGAALDRGGGYTPRAATNGTAHNTPSSREVYPGMMATQSGITMRKEFQPQSVLSSSSTPSVRQETYTDPVTGDIITKTITTVLTETTTTAVSRPTTSPPREDRAGDDDFDVEEERRLAEEFLAASERRSMAPGLQPPPRARGSMRQDNPGQTATQFHDISETTSRPRQYLSGRRSPERRSSYHRSELLENGLEKVQPLETRRRAPAETTIIYAQSTFGAAAHRNRSPEDTPSPADTQRAADTHRPAENHQPAQNHRAADVGAPEFARQRQAPAIHQQQRTAQPVEVEQRPAERRLSVPRGQPATQRRLTPPPETQEPRELTPSPNRVSRGSFGEVLRGKGDGTAKEKVLTKANHLAEHQVGAVRS